MNQRGNDRSYDSPSHTTISKVRHLKCGASPQLLLRSGWASISELTRNFCRFSRIIPFMAKGTKFHPHESVVFYASSLEEGLRLLRIR
jgi:hypothetical protein